VPNLDTRSRKQLLYLVRRYLLGMQSEQAADEVPGERRWLVGYGIASLTYRMAMVITIGLVIATKLFALGAALAVASVGQMLVLPILRGLRFLARGRELRGRRKRAWLGAGGAALAVTVLLFIVPAPFALVAPGVVWVPSDAIVRAGADGFVRDDRPPRRARTSPRARCCSASRTLSPSRMSRRSRPMSPSRRAASMPSGWLTASRPA